MTTNKPTYYPTAPVSSQAEKHTFSAKERDVETGLSYFGARYYSSDLSIWLSVDPMANKYPSMSPYTYCANNPVKLVDPNGEEIVISESVDDQGNKVVNIKFTAALIDRTGYLGEKSKISDKEMETYKTAIAQSIQNTYSGKKDDGTIVNVDVDINICSSDDLSYVADNRHAIYIVNYCSSDREHSGESPIGGSYMEIRADVCQNNNGFKRNNHVNTLERTAAHEFGHLLGLDHHVSNDNIMNQNPYSGTTVTGKQIGMVCSNYNKQMLNYGLLRTMSERKRGGCR